MIPLILALVAVVAAMLLPNDDEIETGVEA